METEEFPQQSKGRHAWYLIYTRKLVTCLDVTQYPRRGNNEGGTVHAGSQCVGVISIMERKTLGSSKVTAGSH